MTMKDVVQDANVVACTLAINSVKVKVLMDSGATRSFIAESIIDRLKCVVYPLKTNLIIEVANQEKVTVDRICPNCDIIIEGCEAYLAHVKDVEEESLKIEDIPVVNEFPDVFPDELPGLRPDREIEFMFDLAPGTEPVSKAPYRMTPIEIKELATQFQELLDKGVIQSSVSSWGSSVLGHVVNSEGIKVDPAKIEAVMNWERPKTPTEVGSFLRLAGYYQRFIQDFFYDCSSTNKVDEEE
ncbi:uncharacterized protein LOC141718465 [Apium graveolens]|uniref:uncharacterized protein LOC141718465 n=1 Tax=Apium graveolens TaxID=4045 RepID=UPI003D7B8F14